MEGTPEVIQLITSFKNSIGWTASFLGQEQMNFIIFHSTNNFPKTKQNKKNKKGE